ncbi:MAG: UrcA family protein [Hyphomonadaceae bacterium]
MTLSSLAKNLALGACAVVLVAAADAATAPHASAQDYVVTTVNNDVVITAPYTVHRRTATQRMNGLPVETVSLTRIVRYDGLDLRRSADVAELQRRIVFTANQTCAELKQLYPRDIYPPQSSDRECVNQAIRGASAQANAAIAYQNGG